MWEKPRTVSTSSYAYGGNGCGGGFTTQEGWVQGNSFEIKEVSAGFREVDVFGPVNVGNHGLKDVRNPPVKCDSYTKDTAEMANSTEHKSP